ncbi:MAG: NAD(P)-dependent alcohol dehydrogenase, partial [Acidimicrobiales bacterium]
MQAIVHDAYGSADVLRLTELPVPEIGPDEVLVEVRSAGIDRGTWHLMTGRPYFIRAMGFSMGFGLRRPRQRVPGLDVAGTVTAVGASVTRFSPGDEVFGIAKGSLAQYGAAKEHKLSLKPAGLSFEQAAVVPISGLTAIQALRAAGEVGTGHHVLILGASGGVGTYAVQLAKSFGAEVTGVSRTDKTDLVADLGADHVLDHTRDPIADGSVRYDVILDIAGNLPLSQLRRALTDRGTLVVVGNEQGGRITGGFGRTLRAPLVSLFVRQRLTMLVSKEDYADLEVLRPLLESGQVVPALDRTYPLAQAADAMRRLDSGDVRGKLAITV